jgi:hypothetical protein
LSNVPLTVKAPGLSDADVYSLEAEANNVCVVVALESLAIVIRSV